MKASCSAEMSCQVEIRWVFPCTTETTTFIDPRHDPGGGQSPRHAPSLRLARAAIVFVLILGCVSGG